MAWCRLPIVVSLLLAACTRGVSTPMPDSGVARVDSGPPGCAVPLPLAPENGALTGTVLAGAETTLRPVFRWVAASTGCSSVSYELAVDDSCDTPGFASCAFPSPEVSLTGISGTMAQPDADLFVSTTAPVGRRYYWRVRACAATECGAWSQVRYVDVGRAHADFDGDGRSDVVVGGPNVSTVDSSDGSAFVYPGTATGVRSTPTIRLDNPGIARYGHFGVSVAAGDVDADGFADLVVGAPGNYGPGAVPGEGVVYVYYGGPGGLADTATRIDDPDGVARSAFGHDVAAAGDVNADGYGDVIVGAPEPGGTGHAFVFAGSGSGLGTVPLTSFSGTSGASFGGTVAGVGDVDGDGFSDVLVGAPYEDGAASGAGSAYLHFGAASGPASRARLQVPSPTGAAGGGFGASASGAGDLDGDGYSDFVVGAPGAAGAEGTAAVYFGRSTRGVIPGVVLQNPTHEVDGHFGSSVSGAGDVNGDGYADLIVGANYQGPGDSGVAYLYWGSTSRVLGTPDASLDNPGSTTGGQFGASVASVGDANVDGYADVVVGAPYQAGTSSNEGSAFVFHGSVTGPSSTPSATLTNPTTEDGSNFGTSVAQLETSAVDRCAYPG